MAWQRSSSVPYPSIWRRFEAQDKNGKILKFRVQDATMDMLPEISDNMTEYFMKDEPLSKCLEFMNDEACVKANRDFWAYEINNKCVLVCFWESDDPEIPDKLVGCNMTGVRCKDRIINVEGTAPLLQIYERILIHMMRHQKNIFETFNTDKYLAAFGLSVDANYRNMGIGTEILHARSDMCKALGIPLTINAFSSRGGQATGTRAGFTVLFEKTYSDIEKDLNIKLPNITHDCMKVMYKEVK